MSMDNREPLIGKQEAAETVGNEDVVPQENAELPEEQDEPKEEKENTPVVVTVEGTLDKTFKPDPDGTVLDDSVGRMSIGEHSLEP